MATSAREQAPLHLERTSVSLLSSSFSCAMIAWLMVRWAKAAGYLTSVPNSLSLRSAGYLTSVPNSLSLRSAGYLTSVPNSLSLRSAGYLTSVPNSLSLRSAGYLTSVPNSLSLRSAGYLFLTRCLCVPVQCELRASNPQHQLSMLKLRRFW